MTQSTLFGEPVDEFQNALSRYGVWPMTVWPVDHQDKTTKALKLAIGDDPNHAGATRVGGGASYASEGNQSRSGGKASYPLIGRGGQATGLGASSIYGGESLGDPTQTHTSIFSPAVAAWLLNCYAPTEGVCIDPFAGGGTRAIMAAKHGLQYTGLELREEEVLAVNNRCERAGVAGDVRIIHGDARGIGDWGSANFLLTCPPYYDLEQYEGGPGDLSMVNSYREFLAGIEIVVQGTYAALLPGSYSCWVVGLHRGRDNALLPLHHDIAKIHRDNGFQFYEEIILHQVGNGAIQRVGNFEKGKHHLIRIHEYALIFWRPQGKP